MKWVNKTIWEPNVKTTITALLCPYLRATKTSIFPDLKLMKAMGFEPTITFEELNTQPFIYDASKIQLKMIL